MASTTSLRYLALLLATGAAALACNTKALSVDVTPDGVDGGGGDGGGGDGGAEAVLGPLDPGFTGTPPGVWTATGGATLETWVPPGVDPGVARFDPAKIQGVAFVGQTFAMPAYSLTQQYALETTGIGNGVHARIDNMTLGDVLLGSTASKSRICLGERAFGHDIRFAFGSRASGTFSSDSPTVDLDHVAILGAPECPPAGAFPGGDFESNDGWAIAGPSEIVAAGGPSSGRAGHIVALLPEAGLQHAPVSFPWKTMSRPALRFVATGADLPIQLHIASDFVSDIRGGFAALLVGAAPSTSVVCIPEWMKGLVLPLLFQVQQSGAIRSLEYFIDDVGFVSEPSCPESSFVIAGGFEGQSAGSYWAVRDYNRLPAPYGLPPAPTSGIVTTGGAHGGAAHALLSIQGDCLAATMTQTITVPVSEPGRGPAVKLWYKTTGAGLAAAGMSVGQVDRVALLPASDWTQRTLCLDPSAGNRPTVLEVSALGPSTSACKDIPVETFAFDDIEVTTDPSCPTN